MADKNVYIPLCDNKQCVIQLKEIAKIVKNCTTKHELYDSYSRWFKQHFKDHIFTILHHCPALWRKIRSLEKELKDNESKLILLTLQKSVDESESQSPGHENDQSLNNFFIEFGSEQTVSNDEELQAFACQVNSCVQRYLGEDLEDEEIAEETTSEKEYGWSSQSGSTYSSKPDTAPHGAAPVFNDDTDGPEIEESPDSNVFDKYPDIFGGKEHQHVFVRCRLMDGGTGLNIYPLEKKTSFAERINEINHKVSRDKIMSNNKHILLQTLPHMFEKGDLPSLAGVCGCKYPIVQKRALTLLELAVWEGHETGVQDLFTYLINAEGKIFNCLKELKGEFQASRKAAYLALLERAANVNLMILSAIVMSSMSNETATAKAHSYLDTISTRASGSSQKSKDKMAASFRKVNKFVAESKNFSKVKERVEHLLAKLNGATKDSVIVKCAKDFSSELLVVKVVIVFEMIRKVFRPDADKNSLIFLREYINATKRLALIGKAGPEPVCVVMIVRALTLFLKYRLHHFAHINVQDVCRDDLDILKQASNRKLSDEVTRLLNGLLFHPNHTVRNGMLNIQEVKGVNLIPFIQNEVSRLLDPMLTDVEKIKDVKVFSPKEWKIFSCKLGGQKCVLCIHLVNEKDHRKDTKTTLQNHDDISFNEMYQLIQLQHRNIVQLLAYQRSRVPTFYIMEDCSQDLQTVMLNYRNSGKFFSHLELCQFLLDTISALLYCHDKGYIHRNLTAQCMAFFPNRTVKLSSFGLCVEPGTPQKVIDLDLKNVPLRWSAPESLFKNEFTTQSDIWMVGVLLFEVLTHGMLPFSTLGCSDLELSQRLRDKTARLSHESCIDAVMADLIVECTSFEPESRPFVENVKTRIQNVLQECSGHPRTPEEYPYPKLDDKDKLSSCDFTRGLPYQLRGRSFEDEMNSFSADKKLDVVKVSEFLFVIKKNNQCAFIEEVNHKMPPATLSLFHLEELRTVMPSLRGLKMHTGKQSGGSTYLLTSIPSSDSLSSLTLDGKLSFESVLEIIFHVAVMMSRISNIGLVLGDLYPDAVFVERASMKKIHIMSLGFLKKTDGSEYEVSSEYSQSCIIPDYMVPRVAPELMREKSSSPASDVYCFGSFMWETLTAFDISKNAIYVNAKPNLFANLPTKEIPEALGKNEWVKHNPRPVCCPDKMYQLIRSCVSAHGTERPKIRHVIMKLKEYCNEIFNMTLKEIDLDDVSSDQATTVNDNDNLSVLSIENPTTIDAESFFGDSEFDADLQSLFSTVTKSITIDNPSESSFASDETYGFNNKYISVDYNLSVRLDTAEIDKEDVYEDITSDNIVPDSDFDNFDGEIYEELPDSDAEELYLLPQNTNSNDDETETLVKVPSTGTGNDQTELMAVVPFGSAVVPEIPSSPHPPKPNAAPKPFNYRPPIPPKPGKK